jgi:hypothetical protein
MGQFHVYVTNPRSAHLATEAMLDRTVIAMSSDMDENDEAITGFVQSIEEDADAVPRRWRITILEAESQRSTHPTLCLFGAVGSSVLSIGGRQ